MNKIFFMLTVLVSFKSFSSDNLLQRYQGIIKRYLEISSKIESLKETFNEHENSLSDDIKDELEFSLIKMDGAQETILKQAKILEDCFREEPQAQVLEGMKGCIISCEKK